MKKNNSFKKTFYLGLIILFFVTSITALIIFNLFNVLSPKFKKDKPEIYIDDVKPEKEMQKKHIQNQEQVTRLKWFLTNQKMNR